MNKRVLLVVAAMSLLVAVGLTGCGGTSVADPNATTSSSGASSQPTASMAISDVKEDNLNGMLTYLKGNGAIKDLTKDMKAEMIGAVSGVMAESIYGDKTTFIELYEFDLNNINDKAKAVIQNAKENGKFSSLDGDLNAALSDNGKFLMIYKDKFTDTTNGAIQERLMKLFKGFNPTANASDASSAASNSESQTNSGATSSAAESSVSSTTTQSAAQ